MRTIAFLSCVFAVLSFRKSYSQLLNISHKTNYCNRARSVFAAHIPLEQALQGMVISIGLPISPIDEFYMNFLPNGDQVIPISGFMFDVQNRIAKFGGFQFEYYPLSPIGQLSYTQYIQNSIQLVDFLGDNWYSDTAARREAGVSFTPTIVDASLILVTSNSFVESTPNYFFFFYAFPSPIVWVLIASAIVLNALVRLYIDHRIYQKLIDDENMKSVSRKNTAWYLMSFFKTIYLSLGSFTQVCCLFDLHLKCWNAKMPSFVYYSPIKWQQILL